MKRFYHVVVLMFVLIFAYNVGKNNLDAGQQLVFTIMLLYAGYKGRTIE